MITDSMRLTTRRDAAIWAGEAGLRTAGEEERLTAWIWQHKPAPGCTYQEHPLAHLTLDQFWRIVS